MQNDDNQKPSIHRRACVVSVMTLCVVFRSASMYGAATSGEAILRVPLGHSQIISSIVASSNGRWALTGSWDQSARLWDLSSGQEILRFEGHKLSVTSVAFSPNGHFVATGSTDGTARLWSLDTGQTVQRYLGHSAPVNAIAFSADGRLLLTGSGHIPSTIKTDTSARVWDVQSGKELRVFSNHTDSVTSVAFTPGARFAITGSLDKTVRMWSVDTGVEVKHFGDEARPVNCIALSPDGKLLLIAGSGYGGKGTEQIWDVNTAGMIHTLVGHKREVLSASFSHDNLKLLTVGRDGTARLWDVNTGGQLNENEFRVSWSPTEFVPVALHAAAFSYDDNFVITGGEDGIGRVWNAATGSLTIQLGGAVKAVTAMAVSHDRTLVATATNGGAINIWNTHSGQQTRSLRGSDSFVHALVFSNDDRYVLAGAGTYTGSRSSRSDGVARLWDISTGMLVRSYVGHDDVVDAVAFSPAGDRLATGSADDTVRIWDTASGTELYKFTDGSRGITAVAFSPQGDKVLTGSKDNSVRLWNVSTGKILWKFSGPQSGSNGIGGQFVMSMRAVLFGNDGKRVFIGGDDGLARMLEADSGTEIRRFSGGPWSITSLALSSDESALVGGTANDGVYTWSTDSATQIHHLLGQAGWISAVATIGSAVLSAGRDGTTRIFDGRSGSELAEAISFADGTWAVVDRDGRFDAPNGGQGSKLYWVVDLEPISLDQLRDRFYEPSLLAKSLGFDKEAIRPVDALRHVELYPKVSIRQPAPGDSALMIRMEDLGGGVGRIIVRVNGKEMPVDATPQKTGTSEPFYDLRLPLTPFARWVNAGETYPVEVQAFNARGDLPSPGSVVLVPPSPAGGSEKLNLWAVVVGVSKYADTDKSIDLRYAAKDASDMADAIQLGGEALFGKAYTHVWLLTSGLDPGRTPTKHNIETILDKITQGAVAADVVVVYFAGHGVAYGDEYYYPTQEVTTLRLDDSSIRQQRTVSGQELAERFRAIRAHKQVLILDTCAAGAAEKSISLPRNVSADQNRAIQRMKDRAGLYVLAGAAADRQSYEATPYERGLLTQALLEGMAGASLKQNIYVDVEPWLQYAVDEVSVLAKGLGGIQAPYVATPRTQTRSFDIGLLDESARHMIPLHAPKPIVIRPVFLSLTSGADDLDLGRKLAQALRESTDANATPQAPYVYLDADDLASGIRPTGFYESQGGSLTARLVLTRGKQRTEHKISCSATLVNKCVSSLRSTIASAVADFR